MATHSRRSIAQGFLSLVAKGDKKTAIRSLAATLIIEKKIRDLEFVIKDIRRELWLTKQELRVDITSAHELTMALKKTIETMLKKTTPATVVKADYAVQPTLKGGFIIDGPLSHLDASVARQISTLKRLF